ncbi:MAG: acyloxyacyl hydrolase [Bacteroidales bacterium]|nr:acyloxyacyl hydrolase [Bacteroidales bacterium]
MTVFICLFYGILLSQNETEIRTTLYNCYVAPNYSKLPPIRPGFIGEISFGEKLNGEKHWHKYYKFPTVYLSAFVGYPGRIEYGYILGLSPQIVFDKIIKNNWNYHIKTGFGIAWHTNTYDIKTNPKNKLISTHLTAMANLDIGLSYKFNSGTYLGLSVGALHFSNGHVKLPNIGMNLPAVNIFYKYRYDDSQKDIDYNNYVLFKDKWHFFVNAALGMHEYGSSTKPENGPNYKVYNLALGFTKRTSPIHKYSLGFNFTKYDSFEKFIIYQELKNDNPFLQSTTFGIFGAHEFLFGNFSFYTELGLDIYKPFYRYMITIYGDKFTAKEVLKSINSNKLGLRYYVINLNKFAFSTGINLKVNLAQADFVEIFCNFEF